MIKITKPTDEVKIENLKVLIYAPPGSGKTSLAFTADKPLLLDFDNGSYRAGNRQDVVQVDNWSDVSGISQDDLKPYSTIIIDTAGRMLDVMALHLTQTEKSARKHDGSLSLQGFGKLKAMFDSFMSKLVAMKKDVILIAHEKEVRASDNETTNIRPDIQGGSLQIVKRSMDLIGYLSVVGGKRLLDFNPSERIVAKNSAGLPIIEVADISQSAFDLTLASVFERAKQFINQQGAKGKDFYAFRKKISGCTQPASFDALLDEINSLKDAPLQKMLKQLLNDQSNTAGVIYSKEAAKFINKPITPKE